MRKFFHRLMPSIDKVREVRVLSVFGERVFHPALWHVHRRSAAGGVAVGLFCGLIPGPLQMVGAGIACVMFRVNLPIALVMTLYTNPLTIVPLYLIAYKMGSFVLGSAGDRPAPPPPHWDWSSIGQSGEAISQWMLAWVRSRSVCCCSPACLPRGLCSRAWIVERLPRYAWHSRRRHSVRRSTDGQAGAKRP
jgi:uncharacterized protein (DUF2062 family)